MSLALSEYTSEREEEYLDKRQITYENSAGEGDDFFSNLMSLMLIMGTAGMVLGEGDNALKNYTSQRSAFTDEEYYVPAPRIFLRNDEGRGSRYVCVEWRWLK